MSEFDRLNELVQPLVSRIQAGDRGAFAKMADTCRKRVFRWALSQTGDSDDADEVTQLVMLRLEKGVGSYRGESQFTTWLYRLTRNVITDFQRSSQRRTRLTKGSSGDETAAVRFQPSEGDAAPLEAIHQAHIAELIRFFFRKLPEKQREVFDLVDLQGFAPAEVARMTGMNATTVRAHLFKARRSIRRKILTEIPALAEEIVE